MKLFFTLVFSLSILLNYAQEKSQYFKKKDLKTEVDKIKAKYHRVENIDGQNKRFVVTNLKNDCEIQKGQYLNNKPVGKWIEKDDDCQIIQERDFSKLEYLNLNSCSKCYSEYGAVYDTTIIFPEYPEGDLAMFKYISQNTRFPKEAAELRVSGMVYVSFLIDEFGAVSEIKITKGLHPFFDYEAYRVISEMPKWKPAVLNGKNVPVQYNLPFRFGL